MRAGAPALARAGYPADQIIGQTLDEIVTPAQAQGVRPHYQQGFAGNHHEFINHAADGRTYTLEVVPLKNSDGEIDAVMAVGREHQNDAHDHHNVNRHAA